MSQDDGYVLRKDDEGFFVLHHYSASADEFPPIDNGYGWRFTTMAEAVEKYAELDGADNPYPSEYGLITRLDQPYPNQPKKDAKMQTTKYRRKEFHVDEVTVTEENMEAVAEWANAEVRSDEDGTKYIHVRVHRPLNDRQTKAYVGDHILYAGTGYKVYTHKAFIASFERSSEDVPQEPRVVKNVFENTGATQA